MKGKVESLQVDLQQLSEQDMFVLAQKFNNIEPGSGETYQTGAEGVSLVDSMYTAGSYGVFLSIFLLMTIIFFIMKAKTALK